MIDPISKALIRGLNFWQYAREIGLSEREHPQMFTATKLAFEAKAETFRSPKANGEYIVLNPDGTNFDSRIFHIFTNIPDASAFGLERLGRRKYTIKLWSEYTKTADYRRQQFRQKGLQRWDKIKAKIASERLFGKQSNNGALLAPAKLTLAERREQYRQNFLKLCASKREKPSPANFPLRRKPWPKS